jgi:hypothetical protein
MPLWGKADTITDKPTWLNVDDANDTDLIEEAFAQEEAQQIKGVKTPGWNQYQTYIDCNDVVRHKSESLVALTNIPGAPLAPFMVSKKTKKKSEPVKDVEVNV